MKLLHFLIDQLVDREAVETERVREIRERVGSR